MTRATSARDAHAGAVTTDSLDCRPTKMPSPRAMPSADAAIILQWVVPRHDDTLAAACIVLLNRRDNEYIPKRHTELHTLFPPASQKWTLVSRGNRETLVALPTLDMYLPLRYVSPTLSLSQFDLSLVQLFSDISFGMCLDLMSWVQQVHNAAIVARPGSLGPARGVNETRTRRCQQEGLSLKRESVGTPSTLIIQSWNKGN